MKQTLQSIRRRNTNVTTEAIAKATGISTGEVFVVEAGGFSTNDKVQKVISVFNRLSGLRIQMSDIYFQEKRQLVISPSSKIGAQAHKKRYTGIIFVRR